MLDADRSAAAELARFSTVVELAEAAHVEVALKTLDGGVYGRIADDGRGFVVSEGERRRDTSAYSHSTTERCSPAAGTRSRADQAAEPTVESWQPLDIKT